MSQAPTPRPVTTLRVSPPNQRPFLVHCYTSKLAEKLAKYPDAVVLGQTNTPADGIIPTHVGKTLQQERAEKAAAKLASQNQQRGGKRIERVEKRDTSGRIPPSPRPIEPRPPRQATGSTHCSGYSVVCISSGKHYSTIALAEAGEGIGRTSLQKALKYRPSPTYCKKKVFAYASTDEHLTQSCQRTVANCGPISLPSHRSDYKQSQPIVHVDTGNLYASMTKCRAALHMRGEYLHRLESGEIRQTPAGAVRLATAQEVEQWKQNNQTKKKQ